MKESSKIINLAFLQIMNELEIDFVPLHDIFRSLYGFDKSEPSKEEFQKTCDLLQKLLEDGKIICIEGASLTPTQMTNDEVLNYISDKFKSGNYKEIDYGIWLDLRANWT